MTNTDNTSNTNTTELTETIITELLAIKAVKVSPSKPFQYASGMISPVYTDLRMTISYPELRQHIATGLTALIKRQYPNATVIAGVATAGIPHAAWVAEALSLPLIYVRSHPKDHGTGKQIEGALSSKDHVVLIDDLISTGGSVLGAAKAVSTAGAHVDGVVSVFSYDLPDATTNFEQAKTSLTPLLDYHRLLEHLTNHHELSETDCELAKAWHNDPWHWQPVSM